jgi:two-component system NtrC family sensor kinase
VLRFKLFRWFAVIVLVFGALAGWLGVRMIGQRVVDEAQRRVRSDLNSAWAVYDSQLRQLEVIVHLTAIRGPLVDACAAGNWQDRARAAELQGLLGKVRLDFNIDFMAVVTPEGRVVVRGAAPYREGDFRTDNAILAKALSGASSSGAVVLARSELQLEGDGLAERAYLTLQETPHARPTPEQAEARGMVMFAAAPIEKNGRVVGALYAGVLLNRNLDFVDRVQSIVFSQDRHNGAPSGTVTLFVGDTRIATTVRLENGNRALGTRVSREVADRVLDSGGSWEGRAFVVRDWYLTAYDPIRDPRGAVIGMLYVGTLERPFKELSRALVLRYCSLIALALAAALAVAFLVAARLADPLHRLAEASKKMQRGEAAAPVPESGSCRETDDLIGAFNDMAEVLSDRDRRLTTANAELAHANDALTSLNKDYMETLQFVSHELKSPVASMMNYTYLLRQGLLGPVNEKQREALATVAANERRLVDMLRHYLNLARIESGEMRPASARVALLGDVVLPALASQDVDLQGRRQRVANLVGPNVTLHADAGLVREVFENLLSNAVKYGREGGLITLTAQIDGEWVACAVRNEGEGLAPEQLGRLFGKFSRIETHRDRAHGAGLGLFISRKIVEAHGGAISAASQPGEWTEFRFTFPRGREESAPPAAAT